MNIIRSKFLTKLIQPHFRYISINKIRNVGISAHIDSGKTTFTERILYYTGRISEIHEVKGNDKVGAKMDSMDLEREKGITIQSAATHCVWDHSRTNDQLHFNIIDTPGHVDFTIEVERALRVLDGAVLLVCGTSGIQAQTYTVTKQMNRYNLPRLCFINKLDRLGANPMNLIPEIKAKLNLNPILMQYPIGLEDSHKGVVDLLTKEILIFKGDGLKYDINANLDQLSKNDQDNIAHYRNKLFEELADLDDEIAEYFLEEQFPPLDVIKRVIRKLTLDLKMMPVFCGSAYKNKGVQPVLDAICDYLPSPEDRNYIGYKQTADETEEEVELKTTDPNAPFIGLAFKLETNKFGQLTYMKAYQGSLKKNNFIYDTSGKKYKLSRLIRMHAADYEEVEAIYPGDIFCTFGVNCNSGDTITDGSTSIRMNKMFVPDPVMSMSLKFDEKKRKVFAKAIEKFTREDPTFICENDDETGETIIKGMGELHLDIYSQRLKREFDIDNTLGEPQVNYRESIQTKVPFNYLHKKQTGGSGQYGRVIGYIEPVSEEIDSAYNEFEDKTVGTNISKEFIPAIEKGFLDSVSFGPQTGFPVINVRFVLEDGAMHSVDSSSNAFFQAAKGAFRTAFENADPIILQPSMKLDVNTPSEFQSNVIASLVKRKAQINDIKSMGEFTNIDADCALANMFGYMTELRGLTQGKADFSMEFNQHEPLQENERLEILKKYKDHFEKKKSKEI